ncbi:MULTISPECIES: DUF6445 family protein [Shewanella]|uniref:DUF6445 family protein n=1 Tax=Shewanella TaxID=22 RepID=UPI001CBA6013|nr:MULTISPECIES: DUF6445 family protein [Shewanella]
MNNLNWVKTIGLPTTFFSDTEATTIANRCFNIKKWKLGKPYTNELWPGMRGKKALKTSELTRVESWVKSIIGVDKIWTVQDENVVVDSNTAILVGSKEGNARPHTDSRKLCRYAAVLYLNKHPQPDAGTSFYRLKYNNGSLGGNLVRYPYMNLVDALKTSSLPLNAWEEDISIENRFNRLFLFKGNMVHSASTYFGEDKRDKRLAITFFWMIED